MSHLTEDSIRILEHYARTGNRELYWNYLSQLPGADGYGTLALGVVRNDNLPGQVAKRVMSSGRCVMLALAAAVCASACAKVPPTDTERSSTMSEATQTGRTVNGHTYTDAPVDVTLGPDTFRIPANYLDSQITPWPGEGMSLVIEWPDMGPSAPGARANPRMNDFRKEIRIVVDYVDRLPIETAVDRQASNEAITEEGSLERSNPVERLDLRVAQGEKFGLTPYTIDPTLMDGYAQAYEKKYGKPHPRNPAFADDWYVARGAQGQLTTIIKCDNTQYLKDGVVLRGDDVISVQDEVAAGCHHYLVDIGNSLAIRMSYKRAFLRDWKRMEVAIQELLDRSKAS